MISSTAVLLDSNYPQDVLWCLCVNRPLLNSYKVHIRRLEWWQASLFPIVNTVVTLRVNKGPFLSAFKCDTKECLCVSTLVCGRLVSLSHHSFWQNGSILYPGKVELAERTISNLKNRQTVTLWKKIKQWTPRVALQFCFLSLSIYGYVFISVCAI